MKIKPFWPLRKQYFYSGVYLPKGGYNNQMLFGEIGFCWRWENPRTVLQGLKKHLLSKVKDSHSLQIKSFYRVT